MSFTSGRIDEHGRAWPVQWLVDHLGITLEDIAELAGFSRRAGTRWAHWETFSDVRADLLACRLGLTPREVWPNWDDGVLDDPDIETRPDPGPGGRRQPCTYADDPGRRPARRTRAGRRRLSEQWGPVARQRRLAAGLSQDDLAALTGLNRKTIGRLERTEFYPSEPTQQAIAAALGLDTRELFPC